MFWQNTPLMGALVAMLAAQIGKLLAHWAKTGRFDPGPLWNAGGMPSSHTAMTTALAAAFAFQDGVQSPAFALSTILALIVMYDAAGIRRHAGRQATVINRVVRELQLLDSLPKDIDEAGLKELLGHRPMEVFGGTVLGVIAAATVTGRMDRWELVLIVAVLAVALATGAARRLAAAVHRRHKEEFPPLDRG